MITIENCDCASNCGNRLSLPKEKLSDHILGKEFVRVVDRPHLSSTQIGIGSGLEIEWQCQLNHPIWISSVRNRLQRGSISACPYCSGLKPLNGFNDLETINPDIAKEWDYKKNNSLPSEHTTIENSYAHWQCEKEHKWEARIADRVRYKTKCPYCSTRKVLPGVNDVTMTHPWVKDEWNYDLNKSNPEMYARGNKKKFHWKHLHKATNKWHLWEASILNRTRDNSGCPYCANQKVLAGFNDFQTLALKIADQWDYEKNETKPSEHLYGSHRLAWWICDKKHSWRTSIKARCAGSGCGKCRLVATSRIEQAFHSAFVPILDTINTSYTDKITVEGKKYQVDIFGTHNGQKIAIEYDGKYYHRNSQEKDIERTKILLADGYKVIRIREDNLGNLSYVDKRLCQLSYPYSVSKNNIDGLVKKIMNFINR